MIQNADPNDPAKLRFAKARYRARLRYSLRYPRCPQQILALAWCSARPSVRMLRKSRVRPPINRNRYRQLWRSSITGAGPPPHLPNIHATSFATATAFGRAKIATDSINYQIGFYDRAESRRSPTLAGHGIRHFTGPQRNVIAHFASVGVALIR